MNAQYQLVFQFAAANIENFEDLIALTEALTRRLLREYNTIVDGHDYGLGEFNIFVHTDRPQAVSELAASVIDSERPGIPFAAGHRELTADKYEPLWPPDSQSFVVA